MRGNVSRNKRENAKMFITHNSVIHIFMMRIVINISPQFCPSKLTFNRISLHFRPTECLYFRPNDAMPLMRFGNKM